MSFIFFSPSSLFLIVLFVLYTDVCVCVCVCAGVFVCTPQIESIINTSCIHHKIVRVCYRADICNKKETAIQRYSALFSEYCESVESYVHPLFIQRRNTPLLETLLMGASGVARARTTTHRDFSALNSPNAQSMRKVNQ